MIKSVYTTSVLTDAYEKIRWTELSEQKQGVMEFSIDGVDYEIEVSFHLQKEQGDIIKGLFAAIPQLDAYIQDEGPESDPHSYVIADLQVYDDKVDIEYFGAIVNTQFDVKLLLNHGIWYCGKIGGRIFEPPVCVNDLSKQARM